MTGFLCDSMERHFGRIGIEGKQISKIITENLNPAFEMRPYQREAFQRFILFLEEPFKGRQAQYPHLNFNMATGSGKTYIMAGLILYLYAKGWQNFIFFVNSTNIIEKTRDNFLNPASGKYLFAQKIMHESKEIFIKEISNLDESDEENINIHFTTIQKLHQDLIIKQKENSLTFEDFKGKNLVLLSDEAHHINVGTRQGRLDFESWENTVLRILKSNVYNILLEFTATLDLEHPEVLEKYRDKIIFKYDLRQFRQEGYSKEITLLRSNLKQNERVLQAVILSQYRQEIAALHGLNIKPVVLFKAKRTIAESEKNKENFHTLIERLTVDDIKKISQKSNIPIMQRAFALFKSKDISHSLLIERLKFNFDETKCLSANNDSEKEKNQLLLNSLEEKNNPIRAIFAVQKLNEGWDVLNLFDIVRLYESRDVQNGQPGRTTISEAQLIGRGARYFPFLLDKDQEKFKRKFDSDISHDMKILEELHYHSIDDSRYISELKTALIETGIYEDDENMIEKELKLKESFKKKDFYKRGHVLSNQKAKKDFFKVYSFDDLGVKKKNFIVELSSGAGYTEGFFKDENALKQEIVIEQKDIEIKSMPLHVIQKALADRSLFHFSSLVKIFPNIKSISEFISSESYLGGLALTLKADKKKLSEVSNEDHYLGLSGLLNELENEMKSNTQEYAGTSHFRPKEIKLVFQDKTLRIHKDDERSKGQEAFLKDKDWYVYNANYGTKEEKAFVEMFARRYEFFQEDFKDIYLIRNERAVKIYNFKDGRAFEPDYILFARQKPKEPFIYQIFIEPKGLHLMEYDKWKQEFLKELRKEQKPVKVLTDMYKVTGLPFYNNQNENEFSKALEGIFGEY